MNNNPIGVFDSGVGGTSIWKEIITLLPNENTIYLADIKNAPYGEKSAEEIKKLSFKNTELLINLGCKIIVVACNTATTNAITQLRETYDIPFIGIEPAIKPAALLSNNKAVGILATKGTLSSSLFAKTSGMYANGIDIVEVTGTGLVELIEAGKLNSAEMRDLLSCYLEPMLVKNIDYLVLGCSHYPYLSPILKELLPDHVTIIDSGEAVARQTQKILIDKDLLASVRDTTAHLLYSNLETQVLTKLIEDLDVNKEISYLDF